MLMHIIVDNQWPVCGTCNSPVERFGQHTNALNSDVVFIAQCHGCEERVSITRHELLTITAMTMITAFAPPSEEATDDSIEDADALTESDDEERLAEDDEERYYKDPDATTSEDPNEPF